MTMPFDIKLSTQKNQLILTPSDGDSFIKGVLPAGDLKIKMDLGIGLRKPSGGSFGVYLSGGDSLEVTVPGGAKLGPAEFKNLTTRLNPQGGSGSGVGNQTQALSTGDPAALPPGSEENVPSGVELEVSASLSVKLWSVTATVDKIGFQLSVLEATDGNLGPFEIGVGYKAPDGIGLAIDGPISGGGFLFFDADKAQYAGIVQLQFEDSITITAIGLLTTRMPDGTSGFSLLIMLAVDDFTLNLPLGFKITGLGGMIGINRTVAINVLRSGLKNKTLERVLFPSDPIKNAATIVSTLRSVFPPTPDQYVFGPIAEISWGKEGLLTAKVGIIFELPNPYRLTVLGQIRGVFPNKTKPLIRLNMDVLGVIDFDKGEAFVFATLFDSQLVKWTVTGDAAFLVRWKGDPVFILSVGASILALVPRPICPN